MSSSNGPIDNQLRQHFQRVFDEFEVQPADSLKERIWANLSRDRTGYAVLITGILLLMGTGLYYQSRLRAYQTRVQPRQTLVVTPPTPAAANPTEGSPNLLATRHDHRLTGANHSVTTPAALSHPVGPIPAHSIVDRGLVRPTLPEETGSPAKDRSGKSAIQVAKRPHLTPKRRHPIDPPRRVLSGLGTNFDDPTPSPHSTGPTLAIPTTERAATPLTTRTDQPGQAQESANLEIRSWQALRPLALVSTHDLRAQLSRRVQFLPSRPLSEERPARARIPVRWLVGVAPLSTFQRMTVVAKPQTYVQSVGDPAALSGSTWGYQISGGVEWHQLDFQLSFGQIRRWAYYELSANTFQVEPVGAKQYQVTRLEHRVAENVSLTMLGADVRKQYALGGDHSPYFVRLGGQASYVPVTRQSLFWANAAVGLTLPLGRAYQFQFGPTVEYGFSRLWSAERQLIIHPYLVGATLALRPAKP